MRITTIPAVLFCTLSISAIGQVSVEPAGLPTQTKVEQVVPLAGVATKEQVALAAMDRVSSVAGWMPELRAVPIKVTATMSRVDPATGQPVPKDFVFKIWGPNRYRIETDAQETFTIVTAGGAYTHTKERDAYLPLHTAASIKPIFLPFLLENFDARSADVDVKDAGTEKGMHKVAMHVTRAGEDYATRAVRRASPITVWLADDTGLPTQVEFVKVTVNNENGLVHVVQKYSDYRPVGGVMVPFHQEEWIGELSYTLDIKDVTFNAGLDPAEFNVPKPAATATAKGGR